MNGVAKVVLSRTFTSQISASSHRYWGACKATKNSGFYPRPAYVKFCSTECHYDRIFLGTSDLSLSVSFYQCSVLTNPSVLANDSVDMAKTEIEERSDRQMFSGYVGRSCRLGSAT